MAKTSSCPSTWTRSRTSGMNTQPPATQTHKERRKRAARAEQFLTLKFLYRRPHRANPRQVSTAPGESQPRPCAPYQGAADQLRDADDPPAAPRTLLARRLHGLSA